MICKSYVLLTTCWGSRLSNKNRGWGRDGIIWSGLKRISLILNGCKLAFGLQFQLFVYVRTINFRTSVFANGDFALEICSIGMGETEHGIKGSLSSSGGFVIREIGNEPFDWAASIVHQKEGSVRFVKCETFADLNVKLFWNWMTEKNISECRFFQGLEKTIIILTYT